ncbi:hypothetical protein [Flexithrix dorotheae]|uniref:hypothetical protein n=1 Tax=Flexithrix dorotheae TaxID=70993 RepID=UPI000364AF2C|nr:hypothetical protein [Flexithrix dorotheae]
MKVLLDIKDDKVDFIMELLGNFSFVKTKPLSPYKAEIIEGLKDAMEEIRQIKAGEKKTQSLNSFLNEL